MKKIKFVTNLILLTICIVGCSGKYLLSPFPTTYREGIERELIKYDSEVKVKAIQAARIAEQECNIIDNKNLQNRLDRIMNNLLDQTDESPEGLTINAVNCKGLNAYSYPAARKIYIMKDLIDITDTEDELAFVIAHEISHHYERTGTPPQHRQETIDRIVKHVTDRISDCQLAQQLEANSTWKVDFKQCIDLVKFSMKSQVSSMSRHLETRTDEYALDLHYGAGYKHTAAKSILKKISGKDEFEPINNNNWYLINIMSHPRAKERLENLDSWASYDFD